MKKILSALIPMLTLISILVSNNIFAFAETTKYWEPRPNCQDTIACVNDKEYSDDIKMSYNNDSEQFAISYNGKGVVTNWEFPLSQEDKDYKIISQSNNTRRRGRRRRAYKSDTSDVLLQVYERTYKRRTRLYRYAAAF